MKILTGFLLLIGLFTFQPQAEAYYYYQPTRIQPIRIQPVRIQPVYQYQQVNGYYRSNGTYVNSYIRGVPNSVKYDNLNYYYKDIYGRRVYPNR